ncbi:D-alanyl-D-alanine carboxypeptidase [Actinokineospora alba]|uniref:D-alanyl-D-alanine carboxypeptidase n=1 Tax=Actinokineospora alba TaxID=504798 RepID=A0A1H0R0S2_9PSEU|nr:serine hydrolase domain-containing protein [Actinokineospora alba]TDP70315.1 D-alanyl-D-alanine carboxypeptidase [Actinokineospora alba]SDI34348.1 D-alanyl-D-alanine carboxypeptidase [Actinokineospora alba]SDP22769.1 D-alanyl-D-alanine carboxypeptidase [Actinokineospora alba]
MRTKTRGTSWVLAGVVLAASVGIAPAASAAEPHAATQAAIDTLKTTNVSPGAGVVVRDGDTQWDLSSGTRALGQNLPFGPDHKVRAGSLTKSFTSAITLQLVAEGKLDLDATVETYLLGVVKGNGYDGTKITVRQLLNHTSGIADYVIPFTLNPFVHLFTHTKAEMVGWGLSVAPYFAPGTSHQYSGTNFLLAGMIIEKVTGRTYEQELDSRIITPLGLTNTYIPAPGYKALPPGHVRGYVGRVVYADFTQMVEPSVGQSSGGIVTSGADATKFFQALITGKVVPAAQLAEMLKVTGIPGPGVDYGLGLIRYPLPCGGEAYGHPGVWPGYQSVAAATTDGRSAFVVLNVLPAVDAISGAGVDRTVALGTALCDRG